MTASADRQPPDQDAGARKGTFADLDNIRLRTVGIDVGSSTSHLTFSEVHLQRLGGKLSSRFVPVERRVLHMSKIILTPYLPDYTIDAAALGRFVADAYVEAGVDAASVDSGAVILTGEATKRRNAAAISQQLAEVAGDFVCATAGHRLEANIAAHGSGAVALSRDYAARVLNIDIGGGTTKFALIEDGIIAATAAISVGGRLLALEDGRVSRVEPSGRWFAERLGIGVELGARLDDAAIEQVAGSMARTIMDCVLGREQDIDPSLWLTEPLSIDDAPDAFAFSGGVGRYVHGQEKRNFGDLGPALGAAVATISREAGLWTRVATPQETIRATVIGASQYTVQVSGNTVFVQDHDVLPIRNLRVVLGPRLPAGPIDPAAFATQLRSCLERVEIGIDDGRAIAMNWNGRPYYERLEALATAISTVGPSSSASRRAPPLALVFDKDVAQSVGRILVSELGWSGPLVCLDGIKVGAFDFIDVGMRMHPSGTYPVVVKSLMFGAPQDGVRGLEED